MLHHARCLRPAASEDACSTELAGSSFAELPQSSLGVIECGCGRPRSGRLEAARRQLLSHRNVPHFRWRSAMFNKSAPKPVRSIQGVGWRGGKDLEFTLAASVEDPPVTCRVPIEFTRNFEQFWYFLQ